MQKLAKDNDAYALPVYKGLLMVCKTRAFTCTGLSVLAGLYLARPTNKQQNQEHHLSRLLQCNGQCKKT